MTLDAVDTYLHRPRLVPRGGLYTVVDVGRDAEAFVPEALKATGVLVVPGRGFGPSITNGVRISFGPLVHDTAKITEGIKRLGRLHDIAGVGQRNRVSVVIRGRTESRHSQGPVRAAGASR